MNQQFPNGSVYSPGFSPNQQSTTSQPRPQSNGFPQSIPASTHTLPPINTTSHGSPFSSNTFGPRSQPQQLSGLTSHPDSVSHQASFPIYAPTSSTYYNGQATSFPQASASQPSNSKPRPPPTNAQAQSAYTSVPSQARQLAPMPPQGNAQSFAPGNNTNALQSQEDSQPTHVVGSQGRRGILPSAAGRPAAVAGVNTNGQKAAPAPAKDSEGKYPCPHCTKSYQHSKHLKRHLLRHTGVRPYSCGLCSDTFSRSDILKRHFQKCSVRRGNPTGESHLFHSRANRKNQAQREAAQIEKAQPTINNQAQQMVPYTPTSVDAAFDITSLNLGQANYGGESNRASRSSSIKRSKKSGSTSNRTSLGMVSASGYDSSNYPYSGHVTPDSITTSGAATPYTFQHEARSSQLSPDGTFNRSSGTIDFGFGSASQPPTSTNFSNGSLPHIMGHMHSRGNGSDWSAASQYPAYDEYGYNSGPNTPLHVKQEVDFSSIQDYPHLRTKT